MRKNLIDISEVNYRRYFNLPFSKTLGSEIRKAAYSVHNLRMDTVLRDKNVLMDLLQDSVGLAFLTVMKVGLFVGARLGTGLVLSKQPNGQWSAPCAIGTVGICCGLLVGADVTDYIIILGSNAAVLSFCSGEGQLSVGLEMDIALGAVGRAGLAEINIAADSSIAAGYSYSQSRGAYLGVSLDGMLVFPRCDESVSLDFK